MSYRLTIEPIGEEIEIEEGQTILDAVLRTGLHIPYQCGHGLCSTCKVTVLDGEVVHGESSPFALMDFERDEGVALACSATAQSDITIEADIEEDPDAEGIKVRDYAVRVSRIEDLTPDIKGLFLELDDEGFRFQAGQYVNLHLPGIAVPRAFSIASAPGDTVLELHVRKVLGGEATGFIHDTLEPGTELRITGPLGRFFVRKSKDTGCLFIAGGSGLSSPKSMILDLLAEGYDKPLALFHGVRTVADLYFRDVFDGLAAKHAHFAYTPVLSECRDESDWSGERGFVHEAVARAFPDGFSGLNAYLCGPPPMIEASIRMLMKGRLFEDGIYTERFLTQGDAEEAARASKVFKRI